MLYSQAAATLRLMLKLFPKQMIIHLRQLMVFLSHILVVLPVAGLDNQLALRLILGATNQLLLQILSTQVKLWEIRAHRLLIFTVQKEVVTFFKIV